MIAIVTTLSLRTIISPGYALVKKEFFRADTARGRVIMLLFLVCHTGACFLITNQELCTTTTVLIWGWLGRPFVCECQLSIHRKGVKEIAPRT